MKVMIYTIGAINNYYQLNSRNRLVFRTHFDLKPD